jgi:hypothetical protein
VEAVVTFALAAVACGNGLGHLARQLRVLAELRRRRPDVAVTMHCAGWQVPHVERSGVGVSVVAGDFPVLWYEDGSRYGDWLLGWDAGWDLDAFDLVWSDNLVEPLAHAGARVVLSGSFLWHDVLLAAHPGNRAVAAYAEQCRALLAEHRPMMFASELFAMPAVREQTVMVGVGLVPPRRTKAATQRRRQAVVAVGNSPAAADAAARARGIAARLFDRGWELAADEATLTVLDLPGRVVDTTAAVAESRVVVARAGLGTVSDAAAAGALLVAIPDPNPEISHNARRIVELGLGVAAETEDEALEVALARLPGAVSSIDLDGAGAIATHLDVRLAGER